MRVLITNTRLDGRGGTESFVRSLARGLQRLGHSVLAYSSDLAQQERVLESDVVPVATDLDSLPVPPDIIHAMHHLDAMSALTALPGVPALYHCHGAVWRECAPRHPRIYRYLAVSRTLADRMTIESNIPPSNITFLPNGVDMARFHRVRTLPERPTRTLFFNSRHQPGSDTIAAIRQATSRRGLELDFVGSPFGEITVEPEKLLPGYDLVFASGMSAIEALACGCAVILVGRTTCGEMVTRNNFDRLRQANFAIAVNASPPQPETIGDEIDRYSADECAAVSRRIRREADIGLSIHALLAVYAETIERHRRVQPDLLAEMRATSQYLRRIVPLIKMTDRMLDGQWSSPTRASSIDELRAELTQLHRRLDQR